MKNFLTFFLLPIFVLAIISFGSTTANAQISQNFDGSTSIPSGWTAVAVPTKSTIGVLFNTPASIGHLGNGTWAGGAFSSPNIMAFNIYSASNGAQERLVTPVVSTGSAPVFTFQWTDASMTSKDSMVVEVTTDGGTTWIPFDVDGHFVTRAPGTATNNWQAKSVNISAYANSNVQFAFHAYSNYGYNFGIDNVFIGTLPLNDVGVTAITLPASTSNHTANTITATIQNYGTNNQSANAFNVTVKIWPTSGGSEGSPEFTATEACTTAINGSTSGSYSFSAKWTPASYVAYTVKVYTALSGDETPSNDALTKAVTIVPVTDLQVASIIYPATTGLFKEALGYSVSCTIKNNGTGASGTAYTVEAWIGLTSGFPGNATYFSYQTTPPSINAGATSGTLNLLPSWTPSVSGNYTVRFKVTIAGDEISSNDTKDEARTVYSYNYGTGGPNSGGYYFANSTTGASGSPSQPMYQWIRPDSGTYVLNPAWGTGTADDGYTAAITIPFSFTFFGNTYTTCYICSNGMVTFGAGSTSRFYAAIPTASAPNNFIAGAWLDNNLNTTTYTDTKVYYGGDADRFVITFWHAHKYGSADYITYQVLLTPNGHIKIQYNDAETTNPTPTSIVNSCTVGIENNTGTAGIQYRYNTTGGPMFSSPLAVEFAPNGTDLLPVELSTFVSYVQGRNIVLSWSTKTEKNSDRFVIERKTIAGNWESIGAVKAAVLSNSPKQYSFSDNKLQSGKYQYRLKMIDNDGSFQYSQIVETEIALPKNFSLSQNYPNPFNPSTKIDYNLPLDSKVTLEVYNIVGERMGQLVNEEQSAGYYSIDFNSSSFNKSLSSGVYFYRLNATNKIDGDNFISVKKMVILK